MSEARARTVTVRVKRLPHGEGLPLPSYQSTRAAGLDVVAGVPEAEPVELLPGARALVPTGFALELPPGYEAQVRPRSPRPRALPRSPRDAHRAAGDRARRLGRDRCRRRAWRHGARAWRLRLHRVAQL